MSAAHSPSRYTPVAQRMLFRTCPDCLATMRLWRIEPKLTEVRVDTHFFECDRCGFARSEDIARDAAPPRSSTT